MKLISVLAVEKNESPVNKRSSYAGTFANVLHHLSSLPKDFVWCVLGEAEAHKGTVRVHFLGVATAFEKEFARSLIADLVPAYVYVEVTAIYWCTKHDDCRDQRWNDHELGRACLAATG